MEVSLLRLGTTSKDPELLLEASMMTSNGVLPMILLLVITILKESTSLADRSSLLLNARLNVFPNRSGSTITISGTLIQFTRFLLLKTKFRLKL